MFLHEAACDQSAFTAPLFYYILGSFHIDDADPVAWIILMDAFEDLGIPLVIAKRPIHPDVLLRLQCLLAGL